MIYRTGDRGAYNNQGQIFIYGRADDQIKIGGVRIEPGEVEFTLKKHPEVETCHVIGQKDANGENCLVAYVVAPSNPSIEALYNFLLDTLPPRMIPSGFVMLPEVPLTPSRKLDRKALPSHEEIRPNLATEFVAPKGELEEGLESVFCSLLALDTVGVHDIFSI